MKTKGMLCILIAAALVVSVLVGSAGALSIWQQTAESRLNVSLFIDANALDSVIKDIDVENKQKQEVDEVEEEGDEVEVGGNIVDSIFNKTGCCCPKIVTIYQGTAPADSNLEIAVMAPDSRVKDIDIENKQKQEVDDVEAEGDEIEVDGDITGSTFSKSCAEVAPSPSPSPSPAPGPAPGPAPRPPAGGPAARP